MVSNRYIPTPISTNSMPYEALGITDEVDKGKLKGSKKKKSKKLDEDFNVSLTDPVFHRLC